MITYHKSKDGAELKLSGNALFEILNRSCIEAHTLYCDADPSQCVPVMTGCRWYGAAVVMPLEPVFDAQPDPEAVAIAKAIIRSQNCDYVVMFYPVHIIPNDENDDSEPEFGVIVEIQPRGLPTVKRLIHIDRKARDMSKPLPKLPVIGRTFGVFYPHLLDGRAA